MEAHHCSEAMLTPISPSWSTSRSHARNQAAIGGALMGVEAGAAVRHLLHTTVAAAVALHHHPSMIAATEEATMTDVDTMIALATMIATMEAIAIIRLLLHPIVIASETTIDLVIEIHVTMRETMIVQ